MAILAVVPTQASIAGPTAICMVPMKDGRIPRRPIDHLPLQLGEALLLKSSQVLISLHLHLILHAALETSEHPVGFGRLLATNISFGKLIALSADEADLDTFIVLGRHYVNLQ